MNTATSHTAAHPEGRTLCDSLYAALHSAVPQIERQVGPTNCVLSYKLNRRRVAYVKHLRTRAELSIWFPGPVGPVAGDFPAELKVRVSQKNDGGWRQYFPYELRLSSAEQIPIVVDLLRRLALPQVVGAALVQ